MTQVDTEVIQALATHGVPASTISDALGIPLATLHDICQWDVQQELEEAATSLAHAALQEGMHIVKNGSPQLKLRFIISIFSKVWASVGSTGSKAIDEMRKELNDLLTSTDSSIPESIYATEPTTSDGEVDNPEKGFNS